MVSFMLEAQLPRLSAHFSDDSRSLRAHSWQQPYSSAGKDGGGRAITSLVHACSAEEVNRTMPDFTRSIHHLICSHLDAVRAIAFGPDSTIISASIDCTVKVWRPDAAGATGK